MIKLLDILQEELDYSISKPQIDRAEKDKSIIAVSYYFNTGKNRYKVTFNSFEKPRVFELEFGIDKGEMSGLDTDEMTHEGKAQKVLSTVASIINLFLKNFAGEYDKVVISGTNEKRKEVYRKFFPKKISSEYLDKVTIREGIDDPVKPGILKKRLGKLSCSRVRSAKSKLKDKGTHYAKALQRYLNYHC